MKNLFVKFHDVTFAYDSATTALFKGLTIHIPSGWSGVVGPNGVGKTTLLKLATGLISSSVGYIERPRKIVYCPQRTDDAARVTGKDGVGGKLLNQLSGRLAQAQADLEGIKIKKSYRLGI